MVCDACSSVFSIAVAPASDSRLPECLHLLFVEAV
jgi:hypothetical protein